MSSLDFDLDLDTQMSQLELEWRQAYESSIAARTDYQALAGSPAPRATLLDAARERLNRIEAQKTRILTKIDRLEDHIIGQD